MRKRFAVTIWCLFSKEPFGSLYDNGYRQTLWRYHFSVLFLHHHNCQESQIVWEQQVQFNYNFHIYQLLFLLMDRISCFPCSPLYGPFPGLNGQAALQQQCALCVCGFTGIRDSHSRQGDHGLPINVNDGRKKSVNIVLTLVIGEKMLWDL